MNIKKITFANYKAFEKEQSFELKPMTILIGKNSSGKSSLLRLPLLLANAFSNSNKDELISLQLADLDLGYEFKDLLYNKYETRILKLGLEFENEGTDAKWSVGIQNFAEFDRQILAEFDFTSDELRMSLRLEYDSPKLNLYSGTVNNIEVKNSLFQFNQLLFSGYVIDETDEIKPIQDIDFYPIMRIKKFNSLINKLKYLRPFRAFPKRFYSNKKTNASLHDFNGETIPTQLFDDEILLKKVTIWYRENLDIANIRLNNIDRRGDYFEVNIYQKQAENIPVNLVDVGQGISQSLPVVTQALMDRKNRINIVEQPELHLHPAAHGSIASLMVDSALNNKNSKYIIETHSENFILRIRRLVAEGKIPKEMINIYWINYDTEQNAAFLEQIKLDDNGEVDFWPEGVFSEAFEEVKAIRKAQRTQKVL